MSMTHKAHRFLEANKRSPVVYGSVIGGDRNGPRGIYYRLKDGQTFKLTTAESRAVGYPRWDFEAIDA
jgi:hypothetical protein